MHPSYLLTAAWPTEPFSFLIICLGDSLGSDLKFIGYLSHKHFLKTHIIFLNAGKISLLKHNRKHVTLKSQVHREVIPTHTVYALNIERVVMKLWHPSHEELQQDKAHRQRLAAKEGLLLC